MTISVHAAATQVAAAQEAYDDASAVLAAAAKARDVIVARIAALEADRSAIAARRRAGGGDDIADGARIGLIALDLADLQAMRTEADAEFRKANAAAAEAGNRLSFAHGQLDRANIEFALGRYVGHADRLCAILAETIGEIENLKQRAGLSRNPWAPERTLATKLHALDLQRIN